MPPHPPPSPARAGTQSLDDSLNCPLCCGPATGFAADRHRRFLRCPCCALVFADPRTHLDAAAERAEYDLHHNDLADPGYRRFLSGLATPLLARLEAGMAGLDFGCGPGPLLARMMREAGMQMAVYDPIYAPERSALKRRYDFVTCTEVVEHFRQPAKNWGQLTSLLAPGGWLGVMTGLTSEDPVGDPAERFLKWRYKDDLTHVSFHGLETMRWIARRHGLVLQVVDARVVLMQRPR